MPRNPLVSKRTFRRSRVFLLTHARLGSAFFDIRVRNLSVEGARLEAENPPPVGTDVHLVHQSLESRCRVTWVEGNHFGVEFHFPIDAADIPADMLAGVGNSTTSKKAN